MDKGRQGLDTGAPSPPALGFHAALGGYSPFAQSHRQVAGRICTQGPASASALGPHLQGCSSGIQGPGLQEGKQGGVPSSWGWGLRFLGLSSGSSILPFTPKGGRLGSAGLGIHPLPSLSLFECLCNGNGNVVSNQQMLCKMGMLVREANWAGAAITCPCGRDTPWGTRLGGGLWAAGRRARTEHSKQDKR